MIYKVFALIFLTVCVGTVVKMGDKRLAFPIGIIGAVGIFSVTVPYFSGIIEFFNEQGQTANGSSLIVKAAAIIIICDFLSEICRDAGENAMSSAVIYFCRAAVLFTVVETLRSVVQMIGGLLK